MSNLNLSSRDQKIIEQTQKLLSHACENKRILLEPRPDNLPYSLKQALMQSTTSPAEAQAFLDAVLQQEGSTDEFRGLSKSKDKKVVKDIVEMSYRKFLKTANRLVTDSNNIIESLGFVENVENAKSAEE